jgi:hypothetical protein
MKGSAPCARESCWSRSQQELRCRYFFTGTSYIAIGSGWRSRSPTTSCLPAPPLHTHPGGCPWTDYALVTPWRACVAAPHLLITPRTPLQKTSIGSGEMQHALYTAQVAAPSLPALGPTPPALGAASERVRDQRAPKSARTHALRAPSQQPPARASRPACVATRATAPHASIRHRPSPGPARTPSPWSTVARDRLQSRQTSSRLLPLRALPRAGFCRIQAMHVTALAARQTHAPLSSVCCGWLLCWAIASAVSSSSLLDLQHGADRRTGAALLCRTHRCPELVVGRRTSSVDGLDADCAATCLRSEEPSGSACLRKRETLPRHARQAAFGTVCLWVGKSRRVAKSSSVFGGTLRIKEINDPRSY